nr:MAG TPA: hypothetical protein [Crassvirales sp.]DAO83168.1 MAG TPA: hypothetical protein [Bacteriophage sp.]DAV54006.1 MAG TPA: hypothetical protein [Caudoviricetes sp.]
MSAFLMLIQKLLPDILRQYLLYNQLYYIIYYKFLLNKFYLNHIYIVHIQNLKQVKIYIVCMDRCPLHLRQSQYHLVCEDLTDYLNLIFDMKLKC